MFMDFAGMEEVYKSQHKQVRTGVTLPGGLVLLAQPQVEAVGYSFQTREPRRLGL